MTKQEQNDIIKRVWEEHLQRKDDIPESLADNYSIWLRSIIKQAAGQLTVGNTSEAVQQDEQGQEQEQPQEQAEQQPA